MHDHGLTDGRTNSPKTECLRRLIAGEDIETAGRKNPKAVRQPV